MVRRDTSSIKILPEPFASSLPRRIKIVTTTCGAELMDFAFAKATSAVILNAHDVLINFVTFQLMDFKFRRKPSLRHQPFPPVEFIGFASQFSKTATIPDISTNDVETCLEWELPSTRPEQFIKQIAKPCLEYVHFPRGDGDAFRPIIGNGPGRKIVLGRPPDPLARHVQIVVQVYRLLRTGFGRGTAHVYSITPCTDFARIADTSPEPEPENS